MARNICKFEGCDGVCHGQGYCNMHYTQLKRGQELTPRKYRKPNQEITLDWIKENVEVDEQSGCWIWQKATHKSGYGQLGVDGITKLVHRVVYELVNGPIAPGLVLDHKDCISNACCNPEHLRPTTIGNNNKHRVNLPSNNSTGHRGVYRIAKSGKYIAQVRTNGKQLHIGTYETTEEANEAAIAKRQELFGEFAGTTK